jgi:hypothetical protein
MREGSDVLSVHPKLKKGRRFSFIPEILVLITLDQLKHNFVMETRSA